MEHRPSTTPRHRTLFWAALAIPDQLVPCCFSSASVSRLQLLRGRPLFLFPCGFQVRAWRVVLDAGFLRVCPIQPHFLRSICLATGSCPARSPQICVGIAVDLYEGLKLERFLKITNCAFSLLFAVNCEAASKQFLTNLPVVSFFFFFFLLFFISGECSLNLYNTQNNNNNNNKRQQKTTTTKSEQLYSRLNPSLFYDSVGIAVDLYEGLKPEPFPSR